MKSVEHNMTNLLNEVKELIRDEEKALIEDGGKKEPEFASHPGFSPTTTDHKNQYFKVKKPFQVMKYTGRTKPTNSYYGNAQIHQGIYEPMTLNSGDEIHQYPGEAWYAHQGGKMHSVISKSDHERLINHSPFEKTYGPSSSSPIPSEKHVTRIPEHAAQKTPVREAVLKTPAEKARETNEVRHLAKQFDVPMSLARRAFNAGDGNYAKAYEHILAHFKKLQGQK